MGDHAILEKEHNRIEVGKKISLANYKPGETDDNDVTDMRIPPRF
jgi:hypothetical protein